MDMTYVYEKMSEYQRRDRLKEAELDRLARNCKVNGTSRIELIAFLSGAVLVAFAIVVTQLV